MRISKLLPQIGIAALAVVGSAAAQEALRLTAKLGEVHRYKLAADLTSANFTIKLSGEINRKVLRLDHGDVTLQETRTNMKMNVNENEMKMDDAVLVRVLRPDATTLELRGEGAGPEAYRVAVLSTVKLPDFPLAVDKTWTWDVPADPKHGQVKARAEYKVIGQEKIHEVDAWQIACSVTEEGGPAAASSISTVWVSKADASLVRSESKVKNLPLTKDEPMSGTQTLDLVP
ncbi:MAG TPA: hypothetical protein VKT78_17540 [Fimbriimonadaceae bacterium]|nr:hypothetical protein [Fimbriimonadaceae bacterium]